MHINDKDYNEYKIILEGLYLGNVWWVTPPSEYDEKLFTFAQRKDFSFSLLQSLLEDGRIRLAKHDIFLAGTIEEQIQRFKDVFPKNEDELYNGLWFTAEECPGGAVWVLDDGTLDWT